MARRNNIGTHQEVRVRRVEWQTNGGKDWLDSFPSETADGLFSAELVLANRYWNVETEDREPQRVYEHLRRSLVDLGLLIVELQLECNKESCPTLNVPGGNFLCAVHATPTNCCAIDYSVHTIDGGAAMMTSSKHFPSRQVSSESFKLLQNLARRLYRVYAHVWFSHRELFLQHEQQTHIYKHFLAICDVSDLLPKSSRVIPAEVGALY